MRTKDLHVRGHGSPREAISMAVFADQFRWHDAGMARSLWGHAGMSGRFSALTLPPLRRFLACLLLMWAVTWSCLPARATRRFCGAAFEA